MSDGEEDSPDDYSSDLPVTCKSSLTSVSLIIAVQVTSTHMVPQTPTHTVQLHAIKQLPFSHHQSGDRPIVSLPNLAYPTRSSLLSWYTGTSIYTNTSLGYSEQSQNIAHLQGNNNL